MKILFVTQYYPPELGAAQERLSAYAEYLAEVGHEVTVLTAHPSYQMKRHAVTRCETQEWRNGVRVLRVPTVRAFGPGFGPRLASFVSFMAAMPRISPTRDGMPQQQVNRPTSEDTSAPMACAFVVCGFAYGS